MFCHSIVWDWNHGHFLRGIAAELLARGHAVAVLQICRELGISESSSG